MNLSVRASSPSGTARDGTIVFLHAFPLSGAMWRPQLGAVPDGWRALAPDLRGFGDTPINALPGEVPTGRRMGNRIAGRSEPVLTMRLLADDVATLIEREADGEAVVCGLSLGGYVALELWRQRPERVRALILADTRPEADTDEGRENRLRMAQTVRGSGAEPLAKTLVGTLLAESTRNGKPEVVESVRDMIAATPAETLIAALAGMAARHDSTGELDAISVPTLVLTGEHDTLTPPETGRAMADAIPDATFRVIPDAGHLANMENPQAFNRALREFLQGL